MGTLGYWLQARSSIFTEYLSLKYANLLLTGGKDASYTSCDICQTSIRVRFSYASSYPEQFPNFIPVSFGHGMSPNRGAANQLLTGSDHC